MLLMCELYANSYLEAACCWCASCMLIRTWKVHAVDVRVVWMLARACYLWIRNPSTFQHAVRNQAFSSTAHHPLWYQLRLFPFCLPSYYLQRTGDGGICLSVSQTKVYSNAKPFHYIYGLIPNQHTRELICPRKTSHKRNNKELSRLR